MCLDVEGALDRRYESFRLLSYGGAPIAEPVLRRALETFSCEFVQAFGMTEMPNITYLTAEDHVAALAGRPHLLQSTGRVGPGCELKVVDDDGQEVAVGDVGEILGRGPQIMQGYWNLPDASADALAGGWMHTGDAGAVDGDGYLYVKDRIKDMIVSGAENVYPREVENVLIEHPAVADVAVIGVPSEQWGETVKAFVVLRPSATATEEDLIEHCVGQLAGYKRPRSVELVDELPRNPSGKVLKRVLREPYWAQHERSVS
jgi:acyl-CoA synthetase (AMP-forming)/AMP-acid ligase II